MSGAAPIVYILVAGIAATAVWRLIGLFLSVGVSEESAWLEWVKAVSTALIAGLIARTVLFPPGALADVSPAIRVGAFALGIAVFFAARRHMGLGILCAAAALIAAQYAVE
jgi:hypothetical protein